MHPARPVVSSHRLRLAEITSGLGAGILVLGIGVLAADYLQGLGVPILVAGLVLHAWGMADRHRIEAREGAAQVWWSTAAYWLCWALLAALVVYALARRL